jgi:Cu/Zn superoxide dismutase
MNLQRISIAGAVALAMTIPAVADDAPAVSKSFNFVAQNNSGETGTVTLTGADGKTTVTIELNGAPAAAQPAHIHMGPCAKLNPKPVYALKNVVAGKSTTTVNAPLARILNGGYAVNVHKSTDDLKTYVACADLGDSAMKNDSMTGGSMASPKP